MAANASASAVAAAGPAALRWPGPAGTYHHPKLATGAIDQIGVGTHRTRPLVSATRPPVLGITGNIATGKSLVAGFLSTRGASLIDSDQVVHELYRHGNPVADRVAQRFGTDLLGPAGIDRARLGALVFADPQALAELEAIVHPAVFAAVAATIDDAPPQTPQVIEAIKLVEGQNAWLLDALWVLDSPRRDQIARLRRGRNLTDERARMRVNAQSPAADKLQLFQQLRPGLPAQVIGNHGSVAMLHRTVEREWERFLNYCAGQ